MSSNLPSGGARELRVNALVLSIALGLAACGGGSDSDSGSSTGGTPVATPTPAPVQAPAIATQPAPQSADAGANATFSVNATGSGLSYQWRRDGKDIAGATAASYTLNNLQAGDDGAVFAVEVKNGGGTVVSAGAALKVAAPKGLSLLAGQPGGPGNLDGQDGRLLYGETVGASPSGVLYVGTYPTFPGRIASLRTIDPATGIVATAGRHPEEERPRDIEFDAAGNRYDMLSQAIYKTTPGGVRTLLAGVAPLQPGQIGNMDSPVDGVGARARFGGLADMAIDRDGNLYVADVSIRQIRKVDPAGKVVTLAGNLGYGVVDGVGSKASFQSPQHLTVDRAGNVFVVDAGYPGINTRLRKVTPDGTVTTLTLKVGGAAVTRIDVGTYSGAIASDAAGNLYVTSGGQGCSIRRIAPDGTVTDLAGSATATGHADGKGAAARFCGIGANLPAITTDKDGNLIVLDSDSYTLRRVTLDGDVTTVGGRAAKEGNVDGTGAAATFAVARWQDAAPTASYVPSYALAADAQGNVYVGEADRVRTVTPSGTVTTLPPVAGASSNARYYPGGLAWGGSAIVIEDGVISRVDGSGTRRFVAGQPGPGRALVDDTGANAVFNKPHDAIADGFGNIYVHDVETSPFGGSAVVDRKISPDGVVTTLRAPANGEPITAWYADKDGKVWGAYLDGAVFTIGTDGRRSIVRAAPVASGTPSGLPVIPRPPLRVTAIARDAAGNLYLAQQNDATADVPESWHDLRRIAPDGTETIVAGAKGSSGVRLGVPGSLGYVDAIAPGPDGIVYLMTENAVLRLKL